MNDFAIIRLCTSLECTLSTHLSRYGTVSVEIYLIEEIKNVFSQLSYIIDAKPFVDEQKQTVYEAAYR